VRIFYFGLNIRKFVIHDGTRQQRKATELICYMHRAIKCQYWKLWNCRTWSCPCASLSPTPWNVSCA